MHKIAIVDKMHKDGINLLKNNPNFECEVIEDLSKNYTLFVNRVTQQLATFGGGGAVRF